VRISHEEEVASHPQSRELQSPTHDLAPLLKKLMGELLDLHTHLADSFLNHQARIAEVSQPLLVGL
jgi:hypothetical protein